MTKKQKIAERIKPLLKEKNATAKNPQKVEVYMYRVRRGDAIGKCESVWLEDDNIMCKVWYCGVYEKDLAYDVLTLNDMEILEEYIKNGYAIQ